MSNEDLPIHLQIEPTQICNLRCIGCSFQDVHKGKAPKTLTLKEFKNLVSHSPSVKDISLHGLGEPFYNDDLGRIVEFLQGQGIVSRIVTNGNYFNSKINNRVLLENIQELCFSIDADNKAIYELIRRKGNFESFLKFVSNFSEIVNRKNLLCKLSFNCVISSMNINHVLGIPKIAKNLGIHSISFNPMGQFYYSKDNFNYNYVTSLKILNEGVLNKLMNDLNKKCSKFSIEMSLSSYNRVRHFYTKFTTFLIQIIHKLI